ncbi:MAG TPA: hypothetical protein PLT82_12905 [Candidatus Hydrogenedens sp.]|nr:hypothetical protein [Candidatus Hydrogenedens sp.]HPP60022.1 hypothetical protein [Candidatus Hydrogenedens sp.]
MTIVIQIVGGLIAIISYFMPYFFVFYFIQNKIQELIPILLITVGITSSGVTILTLLVVAGIKKLLKYRKRVVSERSEFKQVPQMNFLYKNSMGTLSSGKNRELKHK